MSSRRVAGFDHRDDPSPRERRQPIGSQLAAERHPDDEPSASPVVLTEAVILEAFLSQIQKVKIAPHLRVRRSSIDTERSIEGDKIIGAEVTFKIGLVWPPGGAR